MLGSSEQQTRTTILTPTIVSAATPSTICAGAAPSSPDNQAHSTETLNNAEFELSDIFYTSQRKGRVFRVRLNAKGFTLQSESAAGVKEQLVNMRDIVGGRCMRLQKQRRFRVCACTSTKTSTTSSSSTKSDTAKSKYCQEKHDCVNAEEVPATDNASDDSAYLYVFAYVLKKRLRNSFRRERTVLTLRFRSFDTFEENMRETERWYRALHWQKSQQILGHCCMPQASVERHLIVLLNPKSGSGKARKLFHQHVTAVLNEAELPYDLHITQHANYAREFTRHWTMPLAGSKTTGIVAVGGDGLFHDILNGILQRPDWQKILRNIPLGIVPCGSGNGLARSIAHIYK